MSIKLETEIVDISPSHRILITISHICTHHASISLSLKFNEESFFGIYI
jgi:hypothetical protein